MSLANCAEIVRRGDPDRFLAAMAAPPRTRASLFVIYAFNVEVAHATRASSEPMVNEIRLQWWADALQAIMDGNPVPPHEVLTPLAETIDRDSVAVLQTVIEARRCDIAPRRFETVPQLQDHLRATSGGLMWAAARALCARDQEAAIRNIGSAAGLANLYRRAPDLAARGCAPIENLGNRQIADMAQDGLRMLRRARKLVPKVAYPATRAGWLADRTLRAVAANPATVTGGGLHISEFSRRTTLLWRVMLGKP